MERTFSIWKFLLIWEFWSTFLEIPFSRENFLGGDKIILSIYILSEISGRIFWVNGIKTTQMNRNTSAHAMDQGFLEDGSPTLFCQNSFEIV